MCKIQKNNAIKRLFCMLSQIENLYLKFIMTIIAIALIVIAVELTNRNLYCTVDIINGSIGIDGAVHISGEVDTYEQNTVVGRNFNQ